MAGRRSTKSKSAEKVQEAAAEAIETKAEETKTEETAKPAATEAAPKKRPGRKPKTETAKVQEPKVEVVVEEAPKAAAKKAPTRRTAKKTVECAMQVQFGGKAYSQDDLLKIAKDIWKYDLKQKAGALSSVELYMKPEENKVYYVMNGKFPGNFDI